jgi:hypothetical protein
MDKVKFTLVFHCLRRMRGRASPDTDGETYACRIPAALLCMSPPVTVRKRVVPFSDELRLLPGLWPMISGLCVANHGGYRPKCQHNAEKSSVRGYKYDLLNP